MPGFFILDLRISSPQESVRFWKNAYQADAATYDDNIRLGSLLDSGNVERLMRWKAGRFQDLATAFARAVPLASLNSRRNHRGTLTDAEMTELYGEVTVALRSAGLQRAGNIIWRIFLCHVAHLQGTPSHGLDQQKLDQALMAFGQFLRSRWGRLIRLCY
jgi:hypothetical protein